jgi:hypothetical protein
MADATYEELKARVAELQKQTAGGGDLQLVLLTDLSVALRARSEPEHLYTAAAVGGFGAVTWGVASLQPEKFSSRPPYKRPAGVAIFGTLLVAFAIGVKIYREHKRYAEIKEDRAKIANQLASQQGATGIIPKDYLSPAPGWGFIYSLAVVGLAAAGAIWFCISVLNP